MRNIGLILLIVGIFQLKAISQEVLLGVDLSYLNEMEDCGAVYYENGSTKDVYAIFQGYQNQVVRFRIWHNPDWTEYGNFADVKKGITRAKLAGMKVLLDFHYSDTWADPGNQLRPAAWQGITDLDILVDSVYNYTFQLLNTLKTENLMPEFVQIGNETNGNILLEEGESLYPNNWSRNVKLFKAGIQATKDVDTSIKTVLHVSDPDNGDWWFSAAKSNGLSEFDIIGLSYYPQWHKQTLAEVGTIVKSLKTKFEKSVWIVETGFPWTLDNNGDAGNILTGESLMDGYLATAQGQKNFLINLNYSVISSGGMGTIYWEPAWVTTSCSTIWGPGSHYENATFFDFDNQLHQGIEYLTYDYSVAPSTSSQVTFYVDMTGVTIVEDVYVTGDFTGTNWQFMKMTAIGNNIYKYTTTLQKGEEGAFIYTVKADWNMALYHEDVPEECALLWGTHRKYVIEGDTEVYAYKWSSCEEITVSVNDNLNNLFTDVYPNPFNERLHIKTSLNGSQNFQIMGMDGRLLIKETSDESFVNTSIWKEGIYLIQWLNGHGQILESRKIVKTIN
ncbi:MAG: hypothetical protein A2W95_06255 [Bacteroidetes bacterium GWA2_40_14]|nr:MAG: hypothetical protein A2W95_06255 [Bacteroidetes bacterium GWA2_40_14]HAZ04206.1 hypothetical protein [Marinilabiliales bacterium]